MNFDSLSLALRFLAQLVSQCYFYPLLRSFWSSKCQLLEHFYEECSVLDSVSYHCTHFTQLTFYECFQIFDHCLLEILILKSFKMDEYSSLHFCLSQSRHFWLRIFQPNLELLLQYRKIFLFTLSLLLQIQTKVCLLFWIFEPFEYFFFQDLIQTNRL